ncbi:hypothetical protein CAPTEDRAFT_194518, partial [Capitella teleta]
MCNRQQIDTFYHLWDHAVSEYHDVHLGLQEGTLTLDKFQRLFCNVSSGIQKELLSMKLEGDRINQITNVYRLLSLRKTIEAIMTCKDNFGLTGNFGTLEESNKMMTNTQSSLNAVSELYGTMIPFHGISEITEAQYRALQVFIESNRTVQWLRENVK